MAQFLVLQDYNSAGEVHFTAGDLLDDVHQPIQALQAGGLAVIEFVPATMQVPLELFLAYRNTRNDIGGEYLSSLMLEAGAFGVAGTPTGPATGDLEGTFPGPRVKDLTITGEQLGSVLYFDGTNWVQLPPSNPNEVLTTQGTTTAPIWRALDTILPSNLVTGFQTEGGGEPVTRLLVGNTLTFKSLVAGSGVTLSSDANELTISASTGAFLPLAGGLMSGDIAMGGNDVTGAGAVTGTTFNAVPLTTGGAASQFLNATGVYSTPVGTGGEDNTASNIGSVAGEVFFQKTGVDLEFRGILGAGGIDVFQDVTDVTVDGSALLPLAGGTMTGTLDMGSNPITSVSFVNGVPLTSGGSVANVLNEAGAYAPLSTTNVLYVDLNTTASVGDQDGSLFAPFATIQQAIDALPVRNTSALVRAVDLIIIANGSYDEDLAIDLTNRNLILMGRFNLGVFDAAFWEPTAAPRRGITLSGNTDAIDGVRSGLLITSDVNPVIDLQENAFAAFYGPRISGQIISTMTTAAGTDSWNLGVMAKVYGTDGAATGVSIDCSGDVTAAPVFLHLHHADIRGQVTLGDGRMTDCDMSSIDGDNAMAFFGRAHQSEFGGDWSVTSITGGIGNPPNGFFGCKFPQTPWTWDGLGDPVFDATSAESAKVGITVSGGAVARVTGGLGVQDAGTPLARSVDVNYTGNVTVTPGATAFDPITIDIPGAFLPLAGGIMAGDIDMDSNDLVDVAGIITAVGDIVIDATLGNVDINGWTFPTANDLFSVPDTHGPVGGVFTDLLSDGTLTFELSPNNMASNTGVIEGGLVTVDVSTTEFSVESGFILSWDATNPEAAPVRTPFGPFPAEAILGQFTFLSISPAGALVKSPAQQTNAEKRLNARIQTVTAINGVNISSIDTEQQPAFGMSQAAIDYIQLLGGINAGNTYFAAASDLTVGKAVGATDKPFLFGALSSTDPNHQVNAEANPTAFAQVFRDSAAPSGFNITLQTDVPAGFVDLGNDFLEAINANNWSIMWMDFSNNGTALTVGQIDYPNLAAAQAGVFTEDPVTIPEVAIVPNTRRTAILVRGNATDLSNSSQAEFVTILSPSGSGGSSAVLSVNSQVGIVTLGLQEIYNQGRVIEVGALGTVALTNGTIADDLLSLTRTFAGLGSAAVVAMGPGGEVVTDIGVDISSGVGATGTLLQVNNLGSGDALDVQDGGVPVLTVTGVGRIENTPTSGQDFAVTVQGIASIDLVATGSGGIVLAAQAGPLSIDADGAMTLASATADVTIGGNTGFALQVSASTVLAGTVAGALDLTPATGEDATITTLVLGNIVLNGVTFDSAGALNMNAQAITNAGAVTSTAFSGPVNGVTLTAAGSATDFLNAAGAYIAPDLQNAYDSDPNVLIDATGVMALSNATTADDLLSLTRTTVGLGSALVVGMGLGNEAVTDIGVDISTGTAATGDLVRINNLGSGDALDVQDGGFSVFQVTGAGGILGNPTSGEDATITTLVAGNIVLNGVTIDSAGDVTLVDTSVLSMNDSTIVDQALSIISPTALAAQQNNYNPTGMDDADYVRITLTGNQTITGIVAVVSGAGTLRKIITNVDTTDVLTLSNEDASSTAANRFACPNGADVLLLPNESVTLIYDETLARWVFSGLAVRTPWMNVNIQTGTSYTVVAADHGNLIRCANVLDFDLTLNADLPPGFMTFVMQYDVGQVSVIGAAALVNLNGHTKTLGDKAVITLMWTGTANEYAVGGASTA